MRWSDAYRTVQLPPKPIRKTGLVFEEFYTSGGVQVTVRHVDPAYGQQLGIAVGDICKLINGIMPKGEAHALALLDQTPSGDSAGHMCVFKTYGLQRIGKPLIIIGLMLMLTIVMIMYELRKRDDDDAREL